MSTTVDQRVVEMQFDNRDFEQNVSTTMSTLDKFKRSLNLSGAAKGLNDVGNAARNVDMGGLGGAIDAVKTKFSALQVMGVTALANITNSAINAGKRMMSALTIDPIKTGFQEYETQINSVQTILANTKSKGSTLDDVNKALDTLNTYADKTIYNFTEMTRNIGTFTAAGIDLDTSVNAIQGIANLAAISGSTSQQASTAMYQLSQALASGTVKLMDWNSVVNAGMGGEIFQDALKKTSEELKTGAEAAIKAKGSFRESLQTGWLTSEVLTETLKKFTTSGANEYIAKYTGLSTEAVEAALKEAEARYGEADAIEYASKALAEKSGKNADEIKSVLDMARTSEDAATKVKTFSQLWDTLKEAAQSGWTQTWEIIVGDFEEAKSLLTEISDTVGEMIGKSADARNKMLQKWKDAGGRDNVIKGLRNAFEGLGRIITPIKEAFSEIFPPMTTQRLLKITKGFKDLTEKLLISSETAEKIKRVFKGVFSIFDIGRKVIVSIGKVIGKAFGSDMVSNLGSSLLDRLASIGDFFTSLNDKFDPTQLTGKLMKFSSGISSIANKIISSLKGAFGFISEGFNESGFSGALSNIVTWFSNFGSNISDAVSGASDKITSFKDIFSSLGEDVETVATKIWEGVKTVFGWISENVSIGDIFAGLAGGGIFMAAKKLSGFLDKIIETIKGLFGKDGDAKGIKDNVSDVLGSLHDSLNSLSTGIKVGSVVAIAVAVGILCASLKSLSGLSMGDISKSLFAIGSLLTMLSLGFRSMSKTLKKFNSKGIVKSSVALVLVAYAIKTLTDAMTKLAGLSFLEISKGLYGVGGALLELSIALKVIDKAKISLRTSIAMIALAKSCQMLGDALVVFSAMTWEEIGRGLTAMGGALGEFVIAMSALNKFGGGKSIFGSIAILIAVQSLEKMSDGLKKFAEMSWDEIKRGLTAMGGALGELTIALGGLGSIAGFSSIFAAGSMYIVVQGLDELAIALKSFGEMTWDEIKTGLTAMGGALGELVIALGSLGAIAGFSSLFAAGSIAIVIQGLDDLSAALKSFAEMTWDEIKTGLVSMGGALGEVAIALGGLGAIAGFSSFFAAGSITIVIQGLADLSDGLKRFGEMTWDEIKRGLVGMGGALGEVATITGLLGGITGLSGVLGAGSLLIAIQGLGDLADAFKKFGDMTWDEITRGLVGMGGALGEVAVISGTLGGLAGFPALIGSGSILLAVQGLGDIADALKEFAEMSWDEIKRGLTAMGGALGEIAIGSLANTLSGIGAMSLSTVAEPLGALADSVKKWENVTVPENLGANLGILAGGILKFTFSDVGAGALATAAPAVGILADSVKKWEGVSVPDDIGTKMGYLANGIEKFTLGGIGAGVLNSVAPGVGTLADSIKKWAGVIVPDGIEADLTSIANGVKSFSFAFLGGWSISALVTPLANLPDSIKKWNDISVPETMESDLTSLATGLKSFSFLFTAGWSIDAIVGPLGELADEVGKWSDVNVPETMESDLTALSTGLKGFSFLFTAGWSIDAISGPLGDLADNVKKWNGVKIPDNLQDNLSSLSSGVKSFSFSFLGGWSLSAITGPLGDLATNVKKWKNVSVPDELESDLKSLSSGVKSFSGIGDISYVISNIDSLYSSVKNLSDIKFGSISDGLSQLSESIKKFGSEEFSDAGVKMIDSLVKSLRKGQKALVSQSTDMVNQMTKAINSKVNLFIASGSKLMTAFSSGLSRSKSHITKAFQTSLSSAVSSVKIYKTGFHNAGSQLAIGFANGINASSFRAKMAAIAMAKTALDAAKEALGIASPSTEGYEIGDYYGLGFVLALKDYESKVYKASGNMADYAKEGLKEAVNKIQTTIDSDMDIRPTIRPVLDLSDVKAGASSINDLLGNAKLTGLNPSINSIGSLMNQRIQNGKNSDIISEISKLRRDINNMERDSYTVNGLTYDDGSNVSEAVKALIRATRVERRV